MTAPTVPTTTASGPLFDVSSVSLGAYTAQQGIAPFGSVLQQAQAPPAQPAPPEPPAQQTATDRSPPPDKRSHDDSNSSSNDSSLASPDNSTNNAPPANDDQTATASAAQAGSGNAATTDSYSQQSNNQAVSNQAASQGTSNTRPTSASSKVSTRTQAASKVAEDDQKHSDSANVVAAQVEASTKLPAVSKSTDGKRQNDKQQSSKAPDSQTPADKSTPQLAAVVVDPVVAPTVQSAATATDVAGKTVNGKAQPVASTVRADSQLTTQPLVSATQTPALLTTVFDQYESHPASPGAASPQAPVASAPHAQPGTPQSAGANLNTTTTEAAMAAALTAQSATTNDNIAANNSVPFAAADAVSIAVDATQAVSKTAADSPKQTEAAAPQTSAASPPPPTSPTTPINSSSGTTLATPSTLAASLSHVPQSDASPSGLSTIDRARFVQRVTRAFAAAGDTGGQIRLRLSPPDLGSLQLQISVKQGTLNAHIQTDTNTAQQVLLDSLPDLRDRLAQQDIRIDRFDVEVAGQSSGGLPQSPQGNPEFSQNDRRFVASRATTTIPAATADAAPAQAAPILTNGKLNVIV